jgi:hypothetical protein
MVLLGSKSQGTYPANSPRASKLVVLSLVLNQEAARTLMARSAAHQMNGLPREVIADTQSDPDTSNRQPASLSSQKKAVGLNMKGQVKAFAS